MSYGKGGGVDSGQGGQPQDFYNNYQQTVFGSGVQPDFNAPSGSSPLTSYMGTQPGGSTSQQPAPAFGSSMISNQSATPFSQPLPGYELTSMGMSMVPSNGMMGKGGGVNPGHRASIPEVWALGPGQPFGEIGPTSPGDLSGEMLGPYAGMGIGHEGGSRMLDPRTGEAVGDWMPSDSVMALDSSTDLGTAATVAPVATMRSRGAGPRSAVQGKGQAKIGFAPPGVNAGGRVRR